MGGLRRVRVGARIHNGAAYVIAVNASRETVSTPIQVPTVGDRTLSELGGSRSVAVAGGRFTDTFAPLEVHVYVARPA